MFKTIIVNIVTMEFVQRILRKLNIELPYEQLYIPLQGTQLNELKLADHSYIFISLFTAALCTIAAVNAYMYVYMCVCNKPSHPTDEQVKKMWYIMLGMIGSGTGTASIKSIYQN